MSELYKIDSISKIHEMMGDEKPLHPLITIIDFADSRIPEMKENIKIMTGFYAIILKESVHCDFKYGRGNYDFEEGSLLFVAPNQVLEFEGAEGAGQAEGWGIFFHPDLIRKSILSERIKEYTFFAYDSNEALHLSDQERKVIAGIAKNIRMEYSHNIDVYSQDVIVSNLELLLSHSKRFYGRQFITRSSHNHDVISKFEKFLNEYYTQNNQAVSGIPSVQYFAEKLNFSAPYLTDLLKQETGKNTQEFIHLKIIDLAKTKLLNSKETVSEIAYDLGFEYPQYFSRMFKKKTGVSPAKYRQLN